MIDNVLMKKNDIIVARRICHQLPRQILCICDSDSICHWAKSGVTINPSINTAIAP